ncbi:MAG: hypothetical protein LUQ71_10290 [Methanoregula sp.]|nr:hypothetical protein [Methanoregula sp.]
MLSETDKATVFSSVPKSLTFNGVTYSVKIEYADRAEVSDLLAVNDIVTTFRYYGDHPDREATPSNRLWRVTSSGTDIQNLRGEKRQVSLSINVHMAKEDAVPVADIIDAYMSLIQVWSISGLADLVDVVECGDVSDLTYLENGIERRQVDITIRYFQGYTETVGTIGTVEDPDLTVS